MFIFKKTPEYKLRNEIKQLKKDIAREKETIRQYQYLGRTRLQTEIPHAEAMKLQNVDTVKRDVMSGKVSKKDYTPEQKAKIKERNQEAQDSRIAHINDLKLIDQRFEGYIEESKQNIKDKTRELKAKEAQLAEITQYPSSGKAKHQSNVSGNKGPQVNNTDKKSVRFHLKQPK